MTKTSAEGSQGTGEHGTDAQGTGTQGNGTQDIFTVLGTMFKDCAEKWNNNANENIEILTRDLQNLYSQFGSLAYQNQNMLHLSAEEVRNKAVEDLYKCIKFCVVSGRVKSNYVHYTACQSKKVLDALVSKLTEEGFTVSYEIGDPTTVITVIW